MLHTGAPLAPQPLAHSRRAAQRTPAPDGKGYILDGAMPLPGQQAASELLACDRCFADTQRTRALTGRGVACPAARGDPFEQSPIFGSPSS